MRYKVSELSGDLLDAAVAKAEGETFRLHGGCQIPVVYVGHDEPSGEWGDYSPSTDWDIAGPIIQRERITIVAHDDEWECSIPDPDPDHESADWRFFVQGKTPLIAAMRAYVASKFGEEIDLP